MRHDSIIEADAKRSPLSYHPCRYGRSRLIFRGPRRPLDGDHVAFAGGSATYGRFLDRPFPALVEEALGEACVNFGQPNGSVDVLAGDPLIAGACRDARLTVVEVTGALNLSNRFYTVHPRRNDRFVAASSVLRALYPDVDFTEVCFTRHLATRLHELGPDRFAIVRAELQAAWSARMRSFLTTIGPRTILLWLAPHLPSDTPWEERENPLGSEPLFVTRRMLDALRPLVRSVVMVQPPRSSDGLVVVPGDEAAAAHALGATAHREAARALVAAIEACF